MSKPFISIIIPAKEESERITTTISEVVRFMEKHKYSYEIFVVSDSSRYRTIQRVRDIQDGVAGLKIIDQNNRGKGYAVKCGMLAATGKLKLFMDADNSVSIDNLERFMEYIQDYDMVVASIMLPGAVIHERNVLYRRILGKISKYIIKFLLAPGAQDTQRGFKLFTDESAEIIFTKQMIDGFGFDMEIFVIAKKHGLKIKEIPVSWSNSGKSSVSTLSYFRTLWELIRIKINEINGLYN